MCMGNAEKTRAAERGASSAHGSMSAPIAEAARRDNAPAPMLAAIEGHTRAFLAVQNGCDHSCTFCVIPAGRGAVALGRAADEFWRRRADSSKPATRKSC